MFKEVDDIVRMGKWAYLKIPGGERCKGCFLLGEMSQPKKAWYCDLRPGLALIFDEHGAFKDTSCPRRESS